MGQEYCGRRIGHGGPWLNNILVSHRAQRDAQEKKEKRKKNNTTAFQVSRGLIYGNGRLSPRRVWKENKQGQGRGEQRETTLLWTALLWTALAFLPSLCHRLHSCCLS